MDSDLFSTIYSFRRSLDLARQIRLQAALAELHHAFRQLNPAQGHPYSLDQKAHLELQKTNAYNQTCHGPKAVLRGTYCYRVTTLESLNKHTINLQARQINFRQMSFTDAYRYVQERHRETGGWLPVTDFFVGKISGERGFTWWTTLELPGPTLDCSCHRMGVPNDWIPPMAIVLRAPIAFIRTHGLAFVPSAIDGFFSHIFHPTFEKDLPHSGMTIDLEDPEDLRPGVDEYVLRPVDIGGAGIECRPVAEQIPVPHRVARDDIAKPLSDYYRRMFEPEP